MDFVIEKMRDEDWPVVQSIYQEGITTGNATFEADAPEWQEWDKTHLKECRLVAKVKNRVVGWAALNPVSIRFVYRGVALVSVKKLHDTDSSYAIYFAQCVIGLWVVVVPANIVPCSIGLSGGLLLVTIGAASKVGQLLSTEGFRYLPGWEYWCRYLTTCLA